MPVIEAREFDRDRKMPENVPLAYCKCVEDKVSLQNEEIGQISRFNNRKSLCLTSCLANPPQHIFVTTDMDDTSNP